MKRGSVAACAALAAAVAVCGLRALPYPFVYDDVTHVADNPHIRTLARPLRFFLDPSTVAVTPTPATEIYRPLATLSHALTFAVFGPGPHGFRLVNLLLHAVNAMLLLFLVRAMLSTASPENAGIAAPADAFPWAAFLAAAAWAVHPVNVESVTWIVGRSNILCGLFFLAALLCRTRGEKEAMGRGWWRAAALAAFALALLAKEQAIVLPLILVACDATLAIPGRRRTGGRGYAAFFKVAGCYLILRLLLVGRMTQRGGWGGGVGEHLAFQLIGFATYLRLLVLPFGLRLDYVFYPPFGKGAGWFILSAAAGALYLVLLLRALRRRSPYALGLSWIPIALLPVLNILPIKAVANERFLYLPAMGLSFLIAWLLAQRPGGGRARLAASAAVVCLGLLSARRVGDWKSEFTLWRDSAQKEPRSFIAQVNYGKACNDEGRSGLAVEAATAALRLTPTCEEARGAALHIRAVALMRMGRARAAERDLRRALEIDDALYLRAALAHLLAAEGRGIEAAEGLQDAAPRPAPPHGRPPRGMADRESGASESGPGMGPPYPPPPEGTATRSPRGAASS